MSDHGVSATANTRVIFRNLEDTLIDCISKSDFVVGCVAWLTHPKIIKALALRRFGSCIVVQKEDFLRPDVGKERTAWKRRLRTAYDQMFCGLDRLCVGGLVRELSVGGDPTLEPIRCVGNHNREKNPAFPRMHNKFLIFCSIDITEDERYTIQPHPIVPHSVWTGSFNLTENATMSLENAVVIESTEIGNAYFSEWAQILALSEPLDWTSEWIEPEWRIGS